MREYILRGNKGHKTTLRVKDNKVFIVNTRLKLWVKCAIITSLTILAGIIIACIIVH